MSNKFSPPAAIKCREEQAGCHHVSSSPLSLVGALSSNLYFSMQKNQNEKRSHPRASFQHFEDTLSPPVPSFEVRVCVPVRLLEKQLCLLNPPEEAGNGGINARLLQAAAESVLWIAWLPEESRADEEGSPSPHEARRAIASLQHRRS